MPKTRVPKYEVVSEELPLLTSKDWGAFARGGVAALKDRVVVVEGPRGGRRLLRTRTVK